MEIIRNKLFIGFSTLCIAIYAWSFLALDSAMKLLAPPINRELGLIEISQSLLLMVGIGLGLTNARKKKSKIFWLVLSLILIVVFLEEIDFGLHYLEFLLGKDPYALNIFGFRNVHNQGNNNSLIKLIILIPQMIFFGVLPFTRIKYPAKAYGFFYLFITLSEPIINWILLKELSDLESKLYDASQLLGELRELAYYLMLLLFITEYREEINRLFSGLRFKSF